MREYQSIFYAMTAPETDVLIREGVTSVDSLFLIASGFNLKQMDFTLFQIDRNREQRGQGRRSNSPLIGMTGRWDTLRGGAEGCSGAAYIQDQGHDAFVKLSILLGQAAKSAKARCSNAIFIANQPNPPLPGCVVGGRFRWPPASGRGSPDWTADRPPHPTFTAPSIADTPRPVPPCRFRPPPPAAR